MKEQEIVILFFFSYSSHTKEKEQNKNLIKKKREIFYYIKDNILNFIIIISVLKVLNLFYTNHIKFYTDTHMQRNDYVN